MTRIWLGGLALSLLLLAASPPGVAAGAATVAGDARDPGATAGAGAGSTAVASGPTADLIQAKLAVLAASSDLSDEERKQAKELYQQALSQVQAAKRYIEAAAAARQLQQSAPAAIAKLQQQPRDQPPAPPSPDLAPNELAQRLTAAQTEAGEARKRLADLDEQLTVQQGRLKAIPVEVANFQQQMADSDNQVKLAAASATPPALAEARLVFVNAQRHALSEQLAALEQERLSHDVRLTLLNARRAVAVADVERTQLQVQQLQEALNERRRDEADAVVQQTAQTRQDVATKPAVLQSAAAANAALSRRLADLVAESDGVNREQTQVNERLSQLSGRMVSSRQQLDIAGSSDAIGPILLEERRTLPDVRHYQYDASERQQRIIEARLAQYRSNEELRQGRDIEAALKSGAVGFEPDWTEPQRQAVVAELRPLLVQRQDLLEKLGGSYADLIAGLVALDDAQRKLVDQAGVYGALLDRHLLWVRSSPTLGIEWLSALAQALEWLTGPTRWREVGQNLWRGVQNNVLPALVGAVLLAGLLYQRRALVRRLAEGVDAIGDVRRDSFGRTARALGVTLLLSLPWPGLMAWLAWLLYGSGNAAEFSQGLARGLMAGALIALSITFLRQLCRPQGIASAHFGWSEAGCQHARRHLYWFVWVGASSALLVKLCDAQTLPLYSDSLGRLVFCAGMSALAALLWRVLHPTQPLIGALAAKYEGTLFWRLRYVWFWLIVGSYLLLALLALSGYYYTALQLRALMLQTAWLLLGLVILVSLFLRWSNISQRRLALQRALAKREAQLAARASKEAVAPSGEVAPPELLELPDLDLSTVDEHTRGLINLLVWVALGFGLWHIWASLIPAFSVLNEIALWQQTVQTAAGPQLSDITLGSVLAAGLLLLLVGFMAHNLPGVLELVVLRRLTVEPGNRNAIITITRYLIVGTGLAVALNIIGVSWSSVQWLVAALGVGLGFGLQEIFANFVSGLILLLERPIRVGDNVTLGEQNGTVRRIHIRATTLIDWDRKEIIVPNKSFITNVLINWTRNGSIARIDIPVKISHSSDPLLVHDVLLALVTAHPLVLKEPAPAVLLLKLGENALEFEVRVFVQEPVNRLPLTHELNNRIFEALRAHQIEIPFPKREIHVQGWPVARTDSP